MSVSVEAHLFKENWEYTIIVPYEDFDKAWDFIDRVSPEKTQIFVTNGSRKKLAFTAEGYVPQEMVFRIGVNVGMAIKDLEGDGK